MSVAILAYQSGDLLRRCLASVQAQTYERVEILIVDNGSTDGSTERIDLSDPRVRLLTNDRNRGYARGMNTGFSSSSGDFFVPLNADVSLHEDYIARSVEVLGLNPSAAAVGGMVVRRSADAEPDWHRPFQWLDGGPQRLSPTMRVVADPQVALRKVAFKVNGACPVYRRDALVWVRQEYGVGPFDPVFDTYGEDVDLHFKLARGGWRTLYEPSMLAAHVGGHASAPSIFDKPSRLRRNLIAARHRTAWRHLRLRLLVLLWPLVLAGDVGFALIALARRDVRAARDVVAAWARVVRESPDIARLRRDRPPGSARGALTWRPARRRSQAVHPAPGSPGAMDSRPA